MKKLIYFNAKDLIDGVNQTQLLECSVAEWINNNSTKIIDAKIVGNKLEFTKALSEDNEPQKGYALIFDVPDDFNN